MHAHPLVWAFSVYYVMSSAISGLPTPKDSSSEFYKWVFAFSHLLAGNVGRVIATQTKMPVALDKQP